MNQYGLSDEERKMYLQLLASKDEIIKAKDELIKQLKTGLQNNQ